MDVIVEQILQYSHVHHDIFQAHEFGDAIFLAVAFQFKVPRYVREQTLHDVFVVKEIDRTREVVLD